VIRAHHPFFYLSLTLFMGVQDKETKEAGDMWRRPAAQLLADDDEFQDYFQGMFP